MFSALLYLQAQSFKNRALTRLRRLRRPKYLIGALFGGIYFALLVVRPFLTTGRYGSKSPFPTIPTETWEFIAAAALLVVASAVWLAPYGRAALVFSEAEIAFLFPAPVRRRTLIHFKLLKSQTGVLFTVLVLTVVSSRGQGIGVALLHAVGAWVLFSTINLHFLGASFARSMLLTRGIAAWKRQAAVLLLLAAFLTAAVIWIKREVPPLQRADLANVRAIVHYLNEAGNSPPARILLAPFRAAARPFLAKETGEFLRVIGPALALLALHYLWVIRSDVAFEEASVEASRRHAARLDAFQKGRGLAAQPRRRSRAPFRLSPTGPPAMALFWKNLLGLGQIFSLRIWLAVAVWVLFMGWSMRSGARLTAWPQVIGMVAAVLFFLSALMGPMIIRQDFRQDLAAIDLLKVYPLRGWQMALGELLAPASILTGVQWLLLLLMASLAPARMAPPGSSTWALALSAAIVVPALNFVTLLIPNAAALAFPAWFADGRTAERGIEVMGQRIIFMFGQLAVFALALVPAALAGGLAYLFTSAAPAAATAAALMLAGEAAAGLAFLGRLFERFDPSAEQT